MSVNLTVNNMGKTHLLQVPENSNLLNALQENNIYLPALCSGRGTCGKCKVQVVSGPFPPTEEDESFFGKEALGQGFRLACKAVVTEDAHIIVPNTREHAFEILTSYVLDEGFEERFPIDSGLKVTHLPQQAVTVSLTDAMEKECGATYAPMTLLQQMSQCLNQGDDVPEAYENGMDVLTDKAGHVLAFYEKDKANPLGVAIDIGTTTIGLELMELLTGKRLATHSLINHQREFGADVISRIVSAREGKLARLQNNVRKDLVQGIGVLCSKAGVEGDEVVRVMIAGNTTMLHLLMGIPCNSLGLYPFKSTLTSMLSYSFDEIFPAGKGLVGSGCRVTLLPSMSAFVGADITAGISFVRQMAKPGKCVLIDIGTNGEMALFDSAFGGDVLCTSTAAGPAFEGGNISCGTGSVPGAISKVRMEDGQFVFETIGGQAPAGLCGSGVMDLVACLIKEGIVDETGIFENEDHKKGFPLAEGIAFTQKDIRELQLAKAAIRAGLEVLLEKGGVTYDQVDSLYLAGGFGYRMDIHSAVTIGLIPQELQGKIVSVGNSALGGCVFGLLNEAVLADMKDICQKAHEVSLSTDPKFNEYFMKYMYFE